MLQFFLATIPIIILLVGMIAMKKSAMKVAPIALLVAFILGLSAFGGEAAPMGQTAVKGVIEGVKIIFLVMTAFAMLIMLQKTKAMDGIKMSLSNITEDKRILLVMIAFCFSAFLEGAAGAGTPTAICAPFLVGIGFTPIQAAIAGMLGAGIAPSFGGAGATTIVGFSKVVETGHFTMDQLPLIASRTGLLSMVGAFLVPFILVGFLFGKKAFKGIWGFLVYIGIVELLSFYLISSFVGVEVVSLGAGIIGVLACVIYSKLTKKSHIIPEEFRYQAKEVSEEERTEIPSTFKSYLPYIILVIALPVIRFSFPLGVLAKYGYVLWIAAVILLVLFISSIILKGVKDYPSYIFEATKKVLPALAVMSSLLAMTNIMQQTGMLSIMAKTLSDMAGPVYPVVAVLIASLGTFLTGTGLGSNVMFGTMHMEASALIGINKSVVFACQNAGGAIGNIICPHNIVAACATVDVLGEEGTILKKSIPAWLILAVSYSIMGLIYCYAVFPV